MNVEHLNDFNWRFETTKEGYTFCYDTEGIQRCGVKNRGNGKPCRQSQPRLRPTGRCNKHQKHAKKGYNHPSTTHGDTSKYLQHLPSKFRDRYESVLGNAEQLYDLSEEIALHTIFTQNLLHDIDSGNFGSLYLELRKLYSDAQSNLRQALSGQNREALETFMEAFNQMGEIVQIGAKDYLARREILDIADKKRAMLKTKSDIEFKGENAITFNQFLLVLELLEREFYRANELEDKEARRQSYAEGIGKILKLEDVS